MNKISIIAGALAISIAGPVLACVDATSSRFGTTIKNNCPRPVHLSFCYGQGCTPPPDGLFVLNPGFEKQVSDGPRSIRFNYCILPDRRVDGRCRRP